MRFRWSAGLLRLLPLLLIAGSSGTAPDGEALVRARMVEARLNEVQGLVAHFTQTLESPALPQPQVESGTVYFLRPGRMRWEYSEPEGKLAIADGERTHLYLPQDRQVISAPMPGDGGGSGLAFMLRPRIDLLREFEVSLGAPLVENGPRPLILTPRGVPGEYDFLILEIGDDHLIESLVVVDPLGGRVTYRFDQLRLVATLEASLFRFEPPPGVEVRRLDP